MVRYTCCVSGCKSISTKGSDITFIKFPENYDLRSQWKAVIGRGPDFAVTDKTRICSKHFRTGKPSLNPNSEDYIPSVFKAEESPPAKKTSYCKSCRKITLNCPCKRAENNEESEEEEEGEVGLHLVDEVGEGEDDGNDDNQQEGEEEDEDEEEQEEDEEEEPEPDAGEVEVSDDDEWTPVAEEKPKQARRSSGRGRKRRQSSSDDDDDELSDAPPPAKTAKTKAARTPKEKPTPSPRQRKQQQQLGGTPAPDAAEAVNENGSPQKGANRKYNNNSTPASGNKRGPNKSFALAVPQVPSIQETKLLEKIKEMEEEHSRKIETLQRNYNMRIANLQEEHTQKFHKMKLEWEVERSNLQTQIDFYKESVHNGMPEELPLNAESFREDQPIIIVRTEHLQDPCFRDE